MNVTGLENEVGLLHEYRIHTKQGGPVRVPERHNLSQDLSYIETAEADDSCHPACMRQH